MITFTWTSAKDAFSYRLLVTRGRANSRPLLKRVVQATSADVVGLDAGTHYWQIEALRDDGDLLFRSEPRRFELVPSAR